MGASGLWEMNHFLGGGQWEGRGWVCPLPHSPQRLAQGQGPSWGISHSPGGYFPPPNSRCAEDCGSNGEGRVLARGEGQVLAPPGSHLCPRRYSLVQAVGGSQHPVLSDQGAPTHMLSVLPQADLPRPLAHLGILP